MKRELLLPSLFLVACGGGEFQAAEVASGVEDAAAADESEDAGTLGTVPVLPDVPWVAPTSDPDSGSLSDAEPVDAESDPDAEPDQNSEPFLKTDESWQCRGSADAQVPNSEASVGGVLHCSAGKYPSPESWAALSTKGGGNRFQNFEAITFWACGTGTIRVELPSVRPEENGYGILVELTDRWTEYRISWKEESTNIFRPDTAYGVTFWLNSPHHDETPAYDLWVDEVRFGSASTPLGTSEKLCPNY